MSRNPKIFKSFSIFYFRVFWDELFQAEYMDKIHREIVTNVLLNHTYFTKIVFIDGKSEKSLEIEFFDQFSTINLRLRVPKYGIFQKKMSMKILFNASLDQSYV